MKMIENQTWTNERDALDKAEIDEIDREIKLEQRQWRLEIRHRDSLLEKKEKKKNRGRQKGRSGVKGQPQKPRRCEERAKKWMAAMVTIGLMIGRWKWRWWKGKKVKTWKRTHIQWRNVERFDCARSKRTNQVTSRRLADDCGQSRRDQTPKMSRRMMIRRSRRRKREEVK